jgi:hypothetical protein
MTRWLLWIQLNTDTIIIKERDSSNLSASEALIVVYFSANEPQTLRNEYSLATKILDTEYKQSSASIDDVIKICENKYMGYFIIRQGIQHIQNKVKINTILKLRRPK